MVTGATSGIGEACALRFAKEGYDVIITGRRDHLLQALAERIEALGVRAKTLCFDVRNQQQVFDVCGSLEADWAEIDVLINNAGLALGLDPLQGGDLDDWNTMIDTNIKGLLYVSRALVPGMVERNRGEIINIGSVAGDAAYANGNVYCGTKAAVKMITDGLRIDTAHTRIRVTNIKPGLVETHFSNVRFHGDDERANSVYQGIKPLTGEDIADVAYYAPARRPMSRLPRCSSWPPTRPAVPSSSATPNDDGGGISRSRPGGHSPSQGPGRSAAHRRGDGQDLPRLAQRQRARGGHALQHARGSGRDGAGDPVAACGVGKQQDTFCYSSFASKLHTP